MSEMYPNDPNGPDNRLPDEFEAVFAGFAEFEARQDLLRDFHGAYAGLLENRDLLTEHLVDLGSIGENIEQQQYFVETSDEEAFPYPFNEMLWIPVKDSIAASQTRNVAICIPIIDARSLAYIQNRFHVPVQDVAVRLDQNDGSQVWYLLNDEALQPFHKKDDIVTDHIKVMSLSYDIQVTQEGRDANGESDKALETGEKAESVLSVDGDHYGLPKLTPYELQSLIGQCSLPPRS